MNLGQGLNFVNIRVGTLTVHEWKWLEQSPIMACVQVWTLNGQEFGTGPLNGSSKNTTGSGIGVFWTEPLTHGFLFCWEWAELHVLYENFASARVGAAAARELGFKRAAHQRQDIPERSTQRAVKSHWWRERGRERGQELIGGSRGISGPPRSHTHTSLSPSFCPHRCKETLHHYIVSFPTFIHQFEKL